MSRRDNRVQLNKMGPIPDGFVFMLKKIALGRWQLEFWFSVPEFNKEITRMLKSGETIDNRSVLTLTEGIYDEYISKGYTHGFSARAARGSINRLKRAIQEQSEKDAT